MQKNLFKPMNWLKICLEVNYYVSAALLVALAALPFVGGDSFFQSNVELYGPLANNLLIMGIYLALMELSVWFYCKVKRNFLAVAPLGIFHLLLIGSLKMYGEINHFPVDSDIGRLFLYTGVSHVLFGLLYFREGGKNRGPRFRSENS